MKKLYILLIIFSVFFTLNVTSQIQTTVDQIIYDHMGPTYRPNTPYFQWSHWGAHEDHLKITTGWEWYDGARPKEWMDYGTNQALSAWGQIIESESGSPITNVRFQIRNHKMYLFSINQWILAEDISNNIEAERFDNMTFRWTGEVIEGRDETNNGGGISYPAQPNYIIHWWRKTWPQRYALPSSYEAIFVTCEIRLIPNSDPNVNLESVRYLAGVSADYYPTNTTYDGSTKMGLSEPRHKFVTPQWKTFTAYIAGATPPNTEIEYREQILSRQLPPNTVLTTEIKEDNLRKEMIIYSNSEFTQITIELPQVYKKSILTIYNVNGQELIKKPISDNQTQIDISHLTNGAYLARLTNSKTDLSKIFIKK